MPAQAAHFVAKDWRTTALRLKAFCLRLPGLVLLLALPIAGCESAPPARVPALPNVMYAHTWGGTPTALPAAAQTVTHITIHHQGEIWDAGGNVPAYLRRLQTWSRTAKGWADIPYHYVVAPNGQVFAARPWQMAGDTNTEYDPRGHVLVMLMGNFEVQHPTAEQWATSVELIAALQRSFGLAAGRIGTHSDHSTQTVCPGAHLLARMSELKAAVQAAAQR